MPKLFCSFKVGLKSAFYGTYKFALILYFCEPLLKREIHYPFKWIQLNRNVKIWTRLNRFEHVFLKHTSKKEMWQRRKTRLWKILILEKSKKIELNEEFIAMWREEQSLWDAMSFLYRKRNETDKSLKRLRFLIEIPWRFLISVTFLNNH